MSVPIPSKNAGRQGSETSIDLVESEGIGSRFLPLNEHVVGLLSILVWHVGFCLFPGGGKELTKNKCLDSLPIPYRYSRPLDISFSATRQAANSG